MTTTAPPRRDAVVGRPLRKVEALAIQWLIEEVQEVVREVAVISDEETLRERLFDILTDNGPVLAKLLAARLIESVRVGDKALGEPHPPEDELLGQAIDGYLAKAWPLVLSPNVTSDEFRKNVLD
jgi:hypothetical protein